MRAWGRVETWRREAIGGTMGGISNTLSNTDVKKLTVANCLGS